MKKAEPFLVIAALVGLSACATTPRAPSDALQAAEIAISNAQADHAADFAPLEMQSALQNIAVAHQDALLADDPHRILARRFADDAQADAELASAMTKLAKADAVNADLQKSSNTLRQELQRRSGS